MPDPRAWMQLPDSILDLSKRTDDADAWAKTQRARIADLWAQTQRQAVHTMATTYQQGLDSLDHFSGGFQGAPETPTTPTAPLGYNDMAGANSGPPDAGLSSTYGQPEGIQAAGTPSQSVGDILQGELTRETNLPSLAQPILKAAQAAPGFVAGNFEAQRYANTPARGEFAREQATETGLMGGPNRFTPDQVQAQKDQAMSLFPVAGIENEAAKVVAPVAKAAIASAIAPDVRAGNILLRKYVSPDVQQVIADAAAKAPQTMEAARRGVVSDETVRQLADAAGLTIDKVIKRWKPGDIENSETISAMRNALNSKAQEIVDMSKAIQGGENTTANQIELQIARREHSVIQQAVTGVGAEYGRGFRSLRQNARDVIASGDVGKMNDLLKKLGGAEWTDELNAKLAQLDMTDATAVHTFLRDSMKPKAADYINEWLYNAILSNPSTHIANGVSNTINALMLPVESYAAAAIDVPLSIVSGRARGRFFGEGTANIYGLVQGFPEGIRAATYTLRHGFNEAEALKGEMPRGQAFRGPLGTAINTPSRMLGAADAFARPILQRASLNAEIFRKAASEGLSGQALKDRIVDLTANVPADLMERATKNADYRLLKQEAKSWAQGLTKLRNTDVAGVQPMRFVIPFIQTPINATKYGLERSPLGLLNPDLWKAVAKRDPAAADMFARSAIGSFIAAGIGSQVATGAVDITGAPPAAGPKRDAFYRQGKLPYAIKLGGTWHSFQRAEPFNHALTQVAAVVDAIRDAKQGAPVDELAMHAAITIGVNVESQTFLTQVNNLFNAMSDPERYGAQFVASLETSMIPASSAMRATANTLDPRQRAPQGPVENIESVIPGVSRNVPPRLNNFGEEQNQPGSPFIPYKWQQANNSPVEAELAKYKVEPGAAGKSIRGMDLTRQENVDYQRMSGQLVKKRLTDLVSNPSYQQLNDAQKARALDLTISRTKDAAANSYLAQLIQRQGKAAIVSRIQQKKAASLPKAG